MPTWNLAVPPQAADLQVGIIGPRILHNLTIHTRIALRTMTHGYLCCRRFGPNPTHVERGGTCLSSYQQATNNVKTNTNSPTASLLVRLQHGSLLQRSGKFINPLGVHKVPCMLALRLL